MSRQQPVLSSTRPGRTEESAADDRLNRSGPGSESSFVAHLLAGNTTPEASRGAMEAAEVRAWSGGAGVLTDGRPAHSGFSCLVRPVPGDRVVVWSGPEGDCWVLTILHRQDAKAPAVLATSGDAVIETKRLTVAAEAVNIAATDFLTSARNRYIVEDTRTQTSRLRVSRIGTDIRQVTTSDDTVHGTFLQRAGTWLSTTTREARLTARSFLFN